MKTQAKEVYGPAQVSKMFELDFSETAKAERTLSFHDRKFLNALETNIRHPNDGHYEIPLPLKEEESTKQPATSVKSPSETQAKAQERQQVSRTL